MGHSRTMPERSQRAHAATIDELVQRARNLVRTRPRVVLGIVGAPGSGKSTIAAAIVSSLHPQAVTLEMDGFHLDDAELGRLGRLERKGAPDTFDVDGYLSVLRRVRRCADDTVYAPRFDRRLEASRAGAVAIEAHHRLVVTEGNYLLLDSPRWRRARGRLDEVWFLDVASEVRRDRLVRRRIAHGETLSDSLDWVRGVDEANASLVETSMAAADLIVTVVGPDTDANAHEADRETRGEEVPADPSS
ncbi:pantothenate kinase [Williamsia muralis]|nr:pantothenate kinase [Williamsia marianensis]